MGARACSAGSWNSCASIESANENCERFASAVRTSAPSSFFGHDAEDDPNGGPDFGGETRSPFAKKQAKVFEVEGGAARTQERPEARQVARKLHEAARAGHLKKAVEAISEGADVGSLNLRGQSALLLAAGSTSPGAVETVRFLLESMSEINLPDDMGWTPLLHACRNNKQESVKLLLENSASVKVRTADGRTAVMLAAMDGAVDLAMCLVDKQAPVNAVDRNQWSALLYACEAGNTDLVRALLKKQADVKLKTREGMTVLMVAAERGDMAVGEMLVKKSVSLNSRNVDGNSALAMSIKANQLHFAVWLLNQGADASLKNKNGEDACMLADSMGFGGLKLKIDLKLRAEGAD